MRDSDGDGLSDDYEIALGFDPNDFDMDDDGISDLMEQQMWEDLKNLDEIPDSMEDLYDCEGDLDGDGITNCMDPDADGDGFSDQEEMMDSDGDGIPDMYEDMIDHLDPNNPDSEGVGIPDKEDQDPPLPEWAEEMSNKNDWTPQPDSNGMGGLEGFYPLAMLAAVNLQLHAIPVMILHQIPNTGELSQKQSTIMDIIQTQIHTIGASGVQLLDVSSTK